MFSAAELRAGESSALRAGLILGVMKTALVVAFLIGCSGAVESDPTPPPLPPPDAAPVACAPTDGTYAVTWTERPGGTCGVAHLPPKIELGWQTDSNCSGTLTETERCVVTGVVTCGGVTVDQRCTFSADGAEMRCVMTHTDDCVSTYDVTGRRD